MVALGKSDGAAAVQDKPLPAYALSATNARTMARPGGSASPKILPIPLPFWQSQITLGSRAQSSRPLATQNFWRFNGGALFKPPKISQF
jgi:hypothetical protein